MPFSEINCILNILPAALSFQGSGRIKHRNQVSLSLSFFFPGAILLLLQPPWKGTLERTEGYEKWYLDRFFGKYRSLEQFDERRGGRQKSGEKELRAAAL